MDQPTDLSAASTIRSFLAYDAIVAQASGMVAVQSNRLPEAALALISTYAFLNQRGLQAVSRDVVALRVRFDHAGDSHAESHVIEPA